MPPGSPRRTLVTPPRRRDSDDVVASLGRALTVKGVVDSEGEIHVHGHVLGRINADCLVVNSGGSVEGDIIAREVRIGGRMNGRVFAFNVTLDSSADVTGRVFHHTVSVAKGARIDGRMPWRPLNFFESFEQPPPENQ
jgi:cytoskeletal protein CcmA (bactofilin family)